MWHTKDDYSDGAFKIVGHDLIYKQYYYICKYNVYCLYVYYIKLFPITHTHTNISIYPYSDGIIARKPLIVYAFGKYIHICQSCHCQINNK